jgi:hypothetical protein
VLLVVIFPLEAGAEGGFSVAAVKRLSEHGSTRAARYATANKIVTLEGKTHVAWLDSISRTMVATFDRGSGNWSKPVHVGDGEDNHGGPALTCDSRGFLHVVFGPHARTPFQHCRSARPNDSSAWVALPRLGVHPTYPSLVCDPEDTLHVIYRGGRESGHPFKLIYQRRPSGGTWSEPVALARCPEEWKGYTHYHASLTISQSGMLHAAFNLYYDGRAKLAGHLASADRGTTWRTADGSESTLPVGSESSAFFLRSETPLKVVNTVCDRAGRPWIAVGRAFGMTIHHFDGEAWREFDVSKRVPTRDQPSKTHWGTLTIDSGDRLFLIAIRGESMVGGVKGDVVLFHSGDYGKRFEEVRLFAPDERLPHTGPSLERFTGHHSIDAPWGLFSTGEKGPDCFGRGLYHRVWAVQLQTEDQ